MIAKRNSERNWRKALLGWIFGILGVFAMIAAPVMSTATVWAEPETSETTTTTETATPVAGKTCESSLGALGWLVCPATGKISEAVDWLYDKIEDILVINPVEMNDSSPIYQIWKYFQGVTNVIFVIFLLVVIYSQLTGVGITNYGIKKVLPKLIVVAVLVNLSFVMCSVLVDASNIIGNGLRGMFENIETATVANSEITGVTMGGTYASIAGGTTLAVGAGVIAFETGAIWMLIPVALGAIVAVASGLITIALRQAVVVMLIMVSPLAMVAYMLPNTEDLFRKWKKLLTKMLVFYPMFSLLFGASSLAGFALIASATDGFGLILGIAVQIFPLFFSWSLMRMSGTFLESINAKLRTIGNRPVAGVRGWAESHREATRMEYLASQNAYTPSLRLRQFISNRRVAREEDTSKNATVVKQRGLAYDAMSHRRKDGTVSRGGEEDYARETQLKEYERIILRDKNDSNKGLSAVRDGKLARNATQLARLQALDARMVEASDRFKDETARTERIDYYNAMGYHRRAEEAVNAHLDAEHGYDADGKRVGSYRLHEFESEQMRRAAEARYAEMADIMEGNEVDTQYVAAAAAQLYDTQNKVVQTKMQKYFELTPATKDVEYRLQELTSSKNALSNIDDIISGLRILNFRGDTDLVRKYLMQTVNPNEAIEKMEGLKLGTHASQSIASFCMFEVKDNDPFLRRFGKYINLETATAYNANKRKELQVTYDEYIKGYHVEPDGELMYAKRPMSVLVEGTSLDSIERTAMSNLDDSLKEAYGFDAKNPTAKWDVEGYLRKRNEVQTAFAPQFISANLKYLSGSEQIKSAVSFLTGYTYSQKKENGRVVTDANGDPVYEWKPVWEDDENGFGADKDKVKAFFQGKTEQYFKDQTPTQILGLRSDYKEPVSSHLTEMWLDEHPEEREALNAQLAEIQTRYSDLPAGEAQKRREADRAAVMADLKNRVTGPQLRKILDGKGKLVQIYNSRRSGAANNAKDWLRSWLELDNDVQISLMLKEKKEEQTRALKEAEARRRAEHPEQSGDDSEATMEYPRVYSDADYAMFAAQLDDIFRNRESEDRQEFYEKSLQLVLDFFGGESIVSQFYRKYYKDNKLADNRELREYLSDLMQNPDYWPDAPSM